MLFVVNDINCACTTWTHINAVPAISPPAANLQFPAFVFIDTSFQLLWTNPLPKTP
jgi:hypothetical protein